MTKKQRPEILPDEFDPVERRDPNKPPHRKARYGVGVEIASGEIGMMHGPFKKCMPALQTIPEQVGGKVYILRFNASGTSDKLYRWSHSKLKWRKLMEKSNA
jgi:hypothetical protein